VRKESAKEEETRRLGGKSNRQRKAKPPAHIEETFPILHVSGDFLTAFDAGSHTVLGIGDIAGKGLSAGMWFTHLVGLIQLFAGSLDDSAAVAVAINALLPRSDPTRP